MVFGLVVRSRGLGGNLMAGLRSLGGGEIHEYTSLLEDTRRQALDRLVQNATLLGANAVLSMRFDSSELSGTMSEIVAYGTAVIVAPDASARASRPPSRVTAGSGDRPRLVVLRARDRCCVGSASPLIALAGGGGTVAGIWLGRDRAGAHRRRRSSSGSAIARRPPTAPARPTGPGGGEPPGDAARAALPPHRRGLRRPDVRAADARLARPADRRAALRRGGLTGPTGDRARTDAARAILAGRGSRAVATVRPRLQEPDTHRWPPIEPGAPARPTVRATPRAAPTRVEARPFPYLNRELSWLEFNARVLHEARDERNPLLERVKFLAIFAGNLDEFFQVRVAGLRQQVEAGKVARSPDGRTAEEQLAAARERVLELVAEHSAIFVSTSGARSPPRASRSSTTRRSRSTTRRSASASSTRSSRS